ncbi:MAG: hypothetical protein QOJ98_386 [Acidobacteriota bacterium]|jgi:hypothetical protein|nr:hypothetical protein [Acidobacteriota bacterium]
MRSPLALILAASLAASAASAQQALVCATAPAGRPCEVFHFHIQLYRPDTKQFVEVSGVNQFASQAACDRARELHVATNGKAVEYLRGIKKQHEADRVGPCHCDMTAEKSAPNFLTDAQRLSHVRQLEETRLRLRERLLDEKLTSDSETVRALWSDPPSTPQLSEPKFAPMPQKAPAPVLTATEDLKNTRTIDTAKPVAAAMDLPLVDLAPPAPPAPPAEAAGGAVGASPADALAESAPIDAPAGEMAAPVAEPAPEEVVVPMPVETESSETFESTVPEEDTASAQDIAERFVAYEKERIQNVLRASSSITDEEIKSQIFEACMQRIQLLSNLRLLIEGSGMRSRLAAAARDVASEDDRLALIGRLFGEDVKPHWAPGDASDVIVKIDPAVAAEPERALRDTTGRVTEQQKKRALYLVLTETQPTEDQLLWLASVVEGFLR